SPPAFVLDREGNILIHPDGAVQKARRSFTTSLPSAVGATRAGVAEYPEAGVDYLAAYAPVPELGWTAVVARPRSEALGPPDALLRSTILVLAVTVLLAGAVAAGASRAISRPVAELSRGASELARGNFGYRLGA